MSRHTRSKKYKSGVVRYRDGKKKMKMLTFSSDCLRIMSDRSNLKIFYSKSINLNHYRTLAVPPGVVRVGFDN